MTRLPPKDKPTLLPCPFCGNDEPVLEKVSALSRLVSVFCNACEISGEKMSTPEAAIAAWNTRTAARTPITSEGEAKPCVDWQWAEGKTGPRCRRNMSCGALVPDDCPLARLTAKLNSEALVEALRSARPYVEAVALGDGTVPEMVVAEATLGAIDAALAERGERP